MNSIAKKTTIQIALLCLLSPLALPQETPAEYQEVLKIVGKSGDYKSNVLKVNIPRNDLHVKVSGYALPTPFGFGGWFALTKGDGGGKAVELANQIKPAIDLIGHNKPGESGGQKSATEKPILDTDRIAKVVGHAGEQTGPVYKITIGRDDLDVKEMGAKINARMGLNTWAAFVGTNDDAAIAGDIAMLESEVTPTLKALRSNGLNVVAIHHHMINSSPMIIFLHYWGRGPADKLATGFKAALDGLGRGSKQ